MIHQPDSLIMITQGHCMHIPRTRIYHRCYPEVRGEGRSLMDAMCDLVNQLNHGLDFVHGRKREALEQAVSEIRSLQATGPRQRPATIASPS